MTPNTSVNNNVTRAKRYIAATGIKLETTDNAEKEWIVLERWENPKNNSPVELIAQVNKNLNKTNKNVAYIMLAAWVRTHISDIEMYRANNKDLATTTVLAALHPDDLHTDQTLAIEVLRFLIPHDKEIDNYSKTSDVANNTPMTFYENLR